MRLPTLFLLAACLNAQERPRVKFRAAFAPNATGLTRANVVSTDLTDWIIGKTYTAVSPVRIFINEAERREIGTHLQLSEADALALKAYIESRLAAWRADANSVDVHFHKCPAEGQYRDWQGCDRDPRASFTRTRQ